MSSWRRGETSPPVPRHTSSLVTKYCWRRQSANGGPPRSRPWTEYASQPDFGVPDGGRLHLGLIPLPFVGNPMSARAFILLLNPGLDPIDYHAELGVPAYRAALLANLRQADSSRGMLSLDPEFAWHGGYRYWHGRLARVISAVGAELKLSYGEARQVVQRELCVMEVFPYHSVTWRLPARIAARLRPAALARRFVHEVVLPRAQARDALVVVTRQAPAWGLTAGPGVVVYEGMARRAAHLGPDSAGGRALIKHLCRI